MLNKVILMGRLTRDPETRYVNDRKVANFTLAVDRARKSQGGEKETDFLDCAVWGARAEFVEGYFTKGMMAIVVGRIQTRHWEDKQGNKRVSVFIQAEEVSFGETKKSREAGSSSGAVPPGPIAQMASDSDFVEMNDDSDVPF